ncbi:MAG: winged helix-turn-helix domain-containing protein [Terracidiphilus sp.]|jgi:DNA-binding winged helix-turn-helix (wHTH) protein/tetratricopeptide (TPR) repeat protein
MPGSESQQLREIYEFGPFRVDPEKEILLRAGEPIPLQPKTFQILLVLVRNNRELVTKDDLMKTVWPDTFVEETNLSRNIFMLRKALGESPQDHQYILTVPGRGYRFAENVRLVPEQELSIVAANHSKVEVQIVETKPWGWFLLAAIVVLAVGAGTTWYLRQRSHVLTEKDTIVLADFANSTGDTVFDDTLRQGLSVQLEQSPYLSIVSDDRIRQILQLMAQPSDARLTPEIARDLCQRAESTAVLEGSIARIGTEYLLIVKAVSCASGETLASTEAQASDKNHVLDALGTIAAGMRSKLGESRGTVKQFDTPLEQATTPSLDALKAFSMGMKALSTVRVSVAIPFFKQAIQLDPNFALAYAWLGLCSNVAGEPALGAEYTRKAYELRDRVSLPEKYLIMVRFNKQVTGNMEKAEQACQVWIQAYPRAAMPHTFLAGSIYPNTGQYEKSVEEGTEAILLNPDYSASYYLSMLSYISLNRIDQAKLIYQHALDRKLMGPYFYMPLYEIAFLENDADGKARQMKAAEGDPEVEGTMLSSDADSAAFIGRLRDARELSRRAADSAQRAEKNEAAATFMAVSALRDGLFGDKEEARRSADLALDRSTGRDVQYGAALAFAYAGDDHRAQVLTDDLARRFPEDTVVQFNFLPTLRAKLANNRGNPAEAIERLRAAAPYELGQSTFSTYCWTAMYPVFARGEAYLAARRGGEAVAEFQRIMDHLGIVLNQPVGALARLGLAQAYVLEGERAKARAAYEDFFALWKHADADVPILKQANVEYSRLK